MLIADKRKNIKTAQKEKGIGYWFKPKKLWPKATAFNVEMSDNAHRYDDMMQEMFLPLATGLANYYGEFSARVQELAVALFNDVYHNPEPALDMVLRNSDCAREYGSDLFEVMHLIGGYNIFFDSGCDEIVDSEEIARDLYLTRVRRGMPVRYFLLYYKGGGIRREDISALSGIPAKYVQWAYNILTTYMWEMLDGIHKRKTMEKWSQRKKPTRQLEEDIELLVDFSKPAQRLNSEMLSSEQPVDPMEANPEEPADYSTEVVPEEPAGSTESDFVSNPSIDDLNRELTRIMAEFGSGEDSNGFDQIPFNPDAGNDI